MENVNYNLDKATDDNHVQADIKINGNVIEVTRANSDEILVFPKDSFKKLLQRLYMS